MWGLGKTFKLVNSLRRHHARVYSGDQLYDRRQCNKKFITNGELQAHIRLHTGEKRHECELCERRFVRKRFWADTCLVLTHQAWSHTSVRSIMSGSLSQEIFRLTIKSSRWSVLSREKITSTTKSPTEQAGVHSGEEPLELIDRRSESLVAGLNKHSALESGECGQWE